MALLVTLARQIQFLRSNRKSPEQWSRRRFTMKYSFVPNRLSGAAVVLLVAVAIGNIAATAQAQLIRGGAVGGVKVDVDGVLSNPDVSELKELRAAWQAGLQEIPADLEKPAELRFVSLRRLDAEIANAQRDGKPLPDAVRYLAGLQRVRYVLVYPEQHDVVIAGPAEGWRADAVGNIVGANSRRPVLLLEDLMVALPRGRFVEHDGHQLLD